MARINTDNNESAESSTEATDSKTPKAKASEKTTTGALSEFSPRLTKTLRSHALVRGSQHVALPRLHERASRPQRALEPNSFPIQTL